MVRNGCWIPERVSWQMILCCLESATAGDYHNRRSPGPDGLGLCAEGLATRLGLIRGIPSTMDALDLESPRWAGLRHAYGPAADTPRLLRKLESRDQAALKELYGSIFHQSDVHTASYAALPHLVHIAASAAPAWAAELLILAGGIHAGRDASKVASLEPDVVAWYAAAIAPAL